jgi:hypothetical protein
MAHGFKSGGREVGSKNKTTLAREKEIEASGLTPKQFLLKVMRGEDILDAKGEPYTPTFDQRLEAAKIVAPYVHPRLQTVEHTGAGGGPIQTQDLSNMDLARSIAFLFSSAAKQQTDEVKH